MNYPPSEHFYSPWFARTTVLHISPSFSLNHQWIHDSMNETLGINCPCHICDCDNKDFVVVNWRLNFSCCWWQWYFNYHCLFTQQCDKSSYHINNRPYKRSMSLCGRQSLIYAQTGWKGGGDINCIIFLLVFCPSQTPITILSMTQNDWRVHWLT